MLLYRLNDFSLVAGIGEISNFDMVKDLDKIAELIEVTDIQLD